MALFRKSYTEKTNHEGAMSWRGNGHLRDISDTFWTFVVPRKVSTRAAGEAQQWGKRGIKGAPKGQNDVDREQNA